MSGRKRARRVIRVFIELLRYDALARCFGVGGVCRRMRPAQPGRRSAGGDPVAEVVESVACATSFYWKPLLCLERSVVTARLLRSEGIPADVVIGCRLRPFFSHAWVEVNGRVVNDSSGWQSKLQPLDRF